MPNHLFLRVQYPSFSMQLLIDLGNTLMKTALWQGSHLLDEAAMEAEDIASLSRMLEKSGRPDLCFVAAVRELPAALMDFLLPFNPVFLSHETKLPFKIAYLSPSTLGPDRIAAVAAAWKRFPGKNTLVIDMGSCITYDLITASGSYEGGSISPGIRMRLRAMHSFTGRLPLLEPSEEAPLTGQTTAESILSGAMNGTRFEMEQYITHYSKLYEDLTVIVGGGDNKYFDYQFKSSIFAASNLVLEGLKVILDFNEYQKIE
jgi:type III pantothenate kinase